ncbi:DUF6456 domain-containing protein [Limibaculum sp. FT325]|uniref:DUF6456 domain-containing protein n=1 Tax=Thermohalobaculum sediminis TaxID=2939436 RepID=UPI0020BF1F94|nr:DUF6456 domain-containing protein [Limibaculum sediminis]MCL5778626.1 DUF6456 domain-containing protein [Limibaculum sediminis]
MAKTQQVLDRCADLAGTVFGERRSSCSAHDAALYLAHVGHGESIRALAAATGTHPSTVSRTIRRVEERRDDPLVDRMLSAAEGQACDEPEAAPAAEVAAAGIPAATPDDAEVEREARRYLRRLAEPDSFLLVAEGAERAGVFCGANGHRKPIAIVAMRLAAEFLRRDWIRPHRRGQASVQYRLSDVGRAWLRRVLAEEADARRRKTGQGFAEAPDAFQHQHKLMAERVFLDPRSGEEEVLEVNLGESPIGWLARRKGPDGRTFLTPAEVEAGERLRNDFELAQIGPSVAQDWRKFLTPGDRYSGSPQGRGPAEGPMMARDRVMKALDSLGPGLSDVALRVCCFLEGLEACERRMGWSARSGKVVLKIALQRLAEHYGLADFRH